MKVEQHSRFSGIYEIKLGKYEDVRGFFRETYNANAIRDTDIPKNFYQDNESFSKPFVIRGLHYQKPPLAQGKLVRVVTGKAIDIFLDLRKDSSTYLQHGYYTLLPGNALYVPPGFAHGFVTVEDTVFHYKCTAPYSKEFEAGIHYSAVEHDLISAIKTSMHTPPPTIELIVSEKDQALPSLHDAVRDLNFAKWVKENFLHV